MATKKKTSSQAREKNTKAAKPTAKSTLRRSPTAPAGRKPPATKRTSQATKKTTPAKRGAGTAPAPVALDRHHEPEETHDEMGEPLYTEDGTFIDDIDPLDMK